MKEWQINANVFLQYDGGIIHKTFETKYLLAKNIELAQERFSKIFNDTYRNSVKQIDFLYCQESTI